MVKKLLKRKKRTAHEGAYWRGAQARRRGRPRSECPYNRNDKFVPGRMGGGSHAFRTAWLKGWEEANGGQL